MTGSQAAAAGARRGMRFRWRARSAEPNVSARADDWDGFEPYHNDLPSASYSGLPAQRRAPRANHPASTENNPAFVTVPRLEFLVRR
jgi:hypothetical protein